MEKIKEKVFSFINKNNMLKDVSTVYVATSGGADSMALLAFMNENKNRLGISVKAVHVNHGIRDITADRDETFVSNYCKNHNIPFIAFNAKKDGIVVPENASEDWARELRYGYFSRLITGNHIRIATAHTLSDQTETVIFRMSRGCGLNGMTGIPAVRDEFIRPFLCLTRAEIEQLVDYYGTSNITDETNLSDDYARNKIRHHVVPVMKAINPDAEFAVGKVCDRISAAYNYIHKVAEQTINFCQKNKYIYDIAAFVNADDVIVDEMISIILNEHECMNENYFSLIKKALKKVKEDETETLIYEFQVSDTKSIMITNKYLSVNIKNIANIPVQEGINVYSHLGYVIEVREVTREEFEADTKDKRNLAFYADADKLNLKSLFISARKDGEKFKPACRVRNKVTNLMRNRALCERDYIPMIKSDMSIIYMWNLGFTDGYTPTPSTQKIYKVVSY